MGQPEPPSDHAGRQDRTGLAYAAAFLALFGWGSLYTASKPALNEVTPLMIAAARACLAALVLASITCWHAGGLVQGIHHLRGQVVAGGAGVAGLGVLSFAATSLLAMGAQQFLSASINGVLNNLSPLWLALLVSATGRARSAALLIGGSALAAVGVATVLLGDVWLLGLDAPALAGTAWIGVGLSLTGSVLIAASNVLGRRVMRGRDPLALTAVGAAWGALPLVGLLALGAGGSFAGFADTSWPTRGLLLWLGTMSTAFNFALWFYALAHLPVTRVSPLAYLVTPLSVALAVVVLKEPAGPGLLIGVAAIVGGIVLAQRGAETS